MTDEFDRQRHPFRDHPEEVPYPRSSRLAAASQWLAFAGSLCLLAAAGMAVTGLGFATPAAKWLHMALFFMGLAGIFAPSYAKRRANEDPNLVDAGADVRRGERVAKVGVVVVALPVVIILALLALCIVALLTGIVTWPG
jgi:hypothetical protein